MKLIFAFVALCAILLPQSNDISLVRRSEIVPYDGFLLTPHTFRKFQSAFDQVEPLRETVFHQSNQISALNLEIKSKGNEIISYQKLTNIYES